MDNLFTNLDSTDSYAILFITIIGFLFGLIVGLLLKGAKARAYRKQLEAEKEKSLALQTEKITLEGNLRKKEEELAQKQTELHNLVEKLEAAESEKRNALTELYEAQQTVEKLEASHHSYASTIDDLNNQIIGLNTKNEHLIEEINAQNALAAAAPVQTVADEETVNRLDAVEEQLQAVIDQNKELRALLDKIGVKSQLGNSDESEPAVEELVSKGKSVLEGKIIEKPNHVDDLTKIKGLGSFTEKKLNELGIFTYRQIADWSDDMVEYITKEIAYIPGRIAKDKWIEQATALMQNEPVTKLPKKYRDNTNLQIIEGIGPKIEALFKAEGINTWTELSASSHKRLKEILTKAGKRYQMHDPTTWAKQATLAANGKWEELEKYQDELKGGRS